VFVLLARSNAQALLGNSRLTSTLSTVNDTSGDELWSPSLGAEWIADDLAERRGGEEGFELDHRPFGLPFGDAMVNTRVTDD